MSPPRALTASPDVAHTRATTMNASAAAISAFHLLILNPGERILQRALMTTPRIAPILFEATSIAEGKRCIITSWLASANVAIKAAANTARSGPNSLSTIPTGTYPRMFATTSEAPTLKSSVALPSGRNSTGIAVAARTSTMTGTRSVILSAD